MQVPCTMRPGSWMTCKCKLTSAAFPGAGVCTSVVGPLQDLEYLALNYS